MSRIVRSAAITFVLMLLTLPGAFDSSSRDKSSRALPGDLSAVSAVMIPDLDPSPVHGALSLFIGTLIVVLVRRRGASAMPNVLAKLAPREAARSVLHAGDAAISRHTV